MCKPATPEEFADWSKEETCGQFTRHTPTWYQTGQNNLFNELQRNAFFGQLQTVLVESSDAFRRGTGAQLFALGNVPTVAWHKKPYESFLEKLYRINCVENASFPDPPSGGWTSLDRAFSSVDDIVRTTIFVAYADGPQYLANKIDERAAGHGLQVAQKEHAQEKGYYARHVYIRLTVPIASRTIAGEFSNHNAAVEIQIATQLQGALREITHFLYEKERLDGGAPRDWKHDFRAGRFRAAYMAHSLRFIEAMIIELRDSVAKETTEGPDGSS